METMGTDHCTSPQSIDFAVMEVKEYEEIYNVVADQNYPDGITKNQKDALRNKAKSSRFEMVYYITVTRSVEKGRWMLCVCVVCVCVCVPIIIQIHSACMIYSIFSLQNDIYI